MERTPLEGARNLAELARNDMPSLIDKIRCRRKPISLTGCYGNLSGHHLSLAVYDYFIDCNLAGLKQHLHVAMKLRLAEIALESNQKFETGSELFYALLSDNPALIDTMANLEPHYFMSHCHNPLAPQFIVHMWQLAIRGDYKSLQDKVDKLAKHGRKAKRKEIEEGRNFFVLLMRGNKQELENLILQHTRLRTDIPWIEGLMSFVACFETKICWLKGIHVQIDHPLVPMALMPIEPLERYDDVYDFLKPGWTPPPESLMDKMGRWFK